MLHTTLLPRMRAAQSGNSGELPQAKGTGWPRTDCREQCTVVACVCLCAVCRCPGPEIFEGNLAGWVESGAQVPMVCSWFSRW